MESMSTSLYRPVMMLNPDLLGKCVRVSGVPMFKGNGDAFSIEGVVVDVRKQGFEVRTKDGTSEIHPAYLKNLVIEVATGWEKIHINTP